MSVYQNPFLSAILCPLPISKVLLLAVEYNKPTVKWGGGLGVGVVWGGGWCDPLFSMLLFYPDLRNGNATRARPG